LVDLGLVILERQSQIAFTVTWSATEHAGVATYTLGLLSQGRVEPAVITTGPKPRVQTPG
jgi:hypothetical protein